MSGFRELVLAMSAERPNARVSTIVALALAVENSMPPDLADAAALARWAGRQHAVTAELTAAQPIGAIKELRALTRCSLVEAKNAIDILRGATA